MRCIRGVLLFLLLACAFKAFPQSSPESPSYSRKNTFGIAAEYSNDSSHILLGNAEQRKLLSFGADYSRRLWMNRIVNWQYLAELRPILFESDPVTKETDTITSPPPVATFTLESTQIGDCQPASISYSRVIDGVTYSGTIVDTCTRRWTFGQGLSPVGSQFNFLPFHRIQPVFSFLGGYMFSTKPIPTAVSGSWNFTFEIGAGVEIYRYKNRSIRAEYFVHHISNAFTADSNPGIDNGVLKIVYSFGR
jgi:hypothetical protein